MKVLGAVLARHWQLALRDFMPFIHQPQALGGAPRLPPKEPPGGRNCGADLAPKVLYAGHSVCHRIGSEQGPLCLALLHRRGKRLKAVDLSRSRSLQEVRLTVNPLAYGLRFLLSLALGWPLAWLLPGGALRAFCMSEG